MVSYWSCPSNQKWNSSVRFHLIPACKPSLYIRITLHRAITVCSIYLPPTAKYDNAVIDIFITQLPHPVLILGDFNAHSHLWGCQKTTIRGKQFEDFLLKHNLSVLNDGSPTYLHPATGSLSAIDLSITDPSLFLDFSWSVDSDQHGSDR